MNSKKYSQSIVGTSEGRPVSDFYPTPPCATEALLEKEQFVGNVWEPACGDGAMSRVLMRGGLDVVSTDLNFYDFNEGKFGVDFLKTSPQDVGMNEVSNIITNPPYNIAGQFAECALSLATCKVALLLKLTFLEGLKRKELFDSGGLKTVYVFRRRLQLGRNGATYKNGGMITFAWFVWQRGYYGKPQIDWIDIEKKPPIETKQEVLKFAENPDNEPALSTGT